MPKPLRKVIILDTETTGTDHKRHGLTQLAGAVLVDGEERERFNLLCRPFESDVIEDEALEVQGITREEFQTRPDPYVAYNTFLKILGRHINKFDKKDKAGFVGFNARFDAEIVRAWFLKCDEEQGKYFGSWFWTPPMDLMAASALLIGDQRPKLANFKLGTVCEYLGIEADGNLHDAAVDVDLTIKLYRRLTDKWFAQWDAPIAAPEHAKGEEAYQQ